MHTRTHTRTQYVRNAKWVKDKVVNQRQQIKLIQVEESNQESKGQDELSRESHLKGYKAERVLLCPFLSVTRFCTPANFSLTWR